MPTGPSTFILYIWQNKKDIVTPTAINNTFKIGKKDICSVLPLRFSICLIPSEPVFHWVQEISTLACNGFILFQVSVVQLQDLTENPRRKLEWRRCVGMKWPIFEQKHHYILILEKTMLVCINTNRVTCLLTCVRFRMHQFEGNLQADLTATQTESNVSHCSRVERMNSQNTRQQSRQLHVINYASSWTEKDRILKALQGLKLLYFIIWWISQCESKNH